MRTLVWRYGAGYVVSEMVSSKPELWDTGKSRHRRVPVPGVTPVAIQLAGTDPAVISAAARRHVDDGVQVIDLNFGCPAKKVCRKAAGSALLGELDRVSAIVEAVATAVDVPVTVKTRTGLTPGDRLGHEAARRAVAAGAQMVVMHARSRQCRFAGPVDYDAVAQPALGVPLLVNGDIEDAVTARAAMRQAGADGVMIGRAALGQPWLFAVLQGAPEPTLAEKWAVIGEHLAMMHEFYGDHAGVRIARKHVQAYFQRLGCADRLPAFQRMECPREQLRYVRNVGDSLLARAA